MLPYRLVTVSAWALNCFLLTGQPATPKFEVGTVKVSKPESDGPFAVVPVRPGVRNGVFEARHMLLKTLLAYAHDVGEVQISGPDWLDKNHYNIAAKVPEGTQQSQVRGMLREFLAERFKVVTRSSVQETEALALIVGGKGHKLHLLAPGERFTPDYPRGSRGLLVSSSDMRDWADFLTRVLGRPVIDQTGLQGRYAGAVAYTPFDRLGVGPSEFPGLPVALKEQLGLELVRRKLTVEMVVVDRANEIPEEN
jgi:uncharacterized protein (TIGR03435 family)